MLKEKFAEFKKLTIKLCGKGVTAAISGDEDELKKLLPDSLDYSMQAFALAEEQYEVMDSMQKKLDKTLTKLNMVLAKLEAAERR